ncbi:MAG: hypothetical protein L6Q66_06035 [Bacteroidia bacterium]|nr:hypothetical protein [Bacteroidia bacterium]
MKIFRLTFIGALMLFISCTQGEQSNDKSQAETKIENDEIVADKPAIALQFINSYVENSNKMKDAVSIAEWIQSNEQASTTLKTELKRIVDEADPELGLEADPLFDAQDYPEKGFELESFDEQTNFLIVKGKGQPDFKLSMKLVQENNKWLVEGCGIVNIPENKRIKR